MKVMVLLGDGMGDYPIEEYNGRTPLQQAEIPNIRRLAAAGKVQLVQTIPEGMSPGSDVANLSMLGFDPRRYYTGRAPIEAAGAGCDMAPEDVAFRCNLVTVQDGIITDHSSGHITTPEGAELIKAIGQALGSYEMRFHPGASYRHLLLWRNGPVTTHTIPPHDVLGQRVEYNMPRGGGAAAITRLMEASREILKDHPVNAARLRAGKSPATQIWLWGQGRRTVLPSFQELYGMTGGVISAVDLVRGIGLLAGLDAPHIPGATGLIDTNYAGKLEAARALLDAGRDFIFLHVEAPDECGHMGDLKLKTRAIEVFDKEVVGPAWRMLQSIGQPYRIVIATDHRTPIAIRSHTLEPVPLLICDSIAHLPEEEQPFDEFVNNGVAHGLAFDIMQTTLKTAREVKT
ncbi:MAG: cofactor-independent phosphoglycerate mutase [Kiritimatiellia bacterium]|jgi:2,3-bisphosphoglycerate-independent phosphoglycerate mutase